MAKTKAGKGTAAVIKEAANISSKGGKAAVQAGYPGLSTYTKNWLSQLPQLGRYGDNRQQQALQRTASLYGRYGDAGRYQKTAFGDIENKYGAAGQYDPAEFSRSDYTTKNIQERMSPYEELVAEQASRRLKKGYDEARAEREAQAVRAGAFGGSGAAIQEEAARRNYLEQKAMQDAQSLQGAYESAVNLYGREVADTMSAEQMEEASRQFGKQTELSGLEGMMAARQQTAAQRAAAKEAEFAGLQGQMESARQQALMAEQRKNMQITNLAALQQGGQYQQDYNLARRMYPMAIAQAMTSPFGSMGNQVMTKPDQPSMGQNIMAGIGAGAGLLEAGGGFKGIGNLFGVGRAAGGLIYRGGGLADLEPEYYDKYER